MYRIKIDGFTLKDDYFRDIDGSIRTYLTKQAAEQQIHVFESIGYAASEDCEIEPIENTE